MVVLVYFKDQMPNFWFGCDCLTDTIFVLDIAVQLRTGYLEQGLMVSIKETYLFSTVFFSILKFEQSVDCLRKHVYMSQ